MNKEAFYQLLHNPGDVTPDQLESLEELVRLFPYCSLAHMLIAKSHYDQATMLASQKLRKAAAYAVNRDRLKKIITGERPVPVQEVSESTVIENQVIYESQAEPVETETSAVVELPEEEVAELPEAELAIEELIIDPPVDLFFDRFIVPLQQQQVLPPESDNDNEEEEPPLHLGHLNEDDLPIEEFSRRAKKHQQWEIIESFIRSEPRISSLNLSERDPYVNRDLSEKSTKPANVVSENMANIYVRQRKYDKAIEMFEKLTLKYPEKKAYFAKRIQELKQF